MKKRNTFEEYKGKINFGVFSLLFNPRNEVCLIWRKNYPWKGYAGLPGGSVKYEESLEDAVKRETFEETGIMPKVEKFIGIYDTYAEDKKARFMGAVFLCSCGNIKPKPQKEEVYKAKFLNLKQVKRSKLAPLTKLILKLYGWDISINEKNLKFLVKGSVV